MSRLESRISALESKAQAGQCYVSTGEIWGLKLYWILYESEVKPKHDPLIGPFRNLKDARLWSLEDLKKTIPSAYDRLLEMRSMGDLLREKYLAVDCMEEDSADFLAKPESQLSEYERKVRASYTSPTGIPKT